MIGVGGVLVDVLSLDLCFLVIKGHMMRVLTEHEVKDLVVEIVEDLNPAMAEEEDLREEVDWRLLDHGYETAESFASSETKQVAQLMEEFGWSEDEVVEVLEKEMKFRLSSKTSKADFWVERIQSSDFPEYEDRSDVPRDPAEHEMAIRSSETYWRLGKEL